MRAEWGVSDKDCHGVREISGLAAAPCNQRRPWLGFYGVTWGESVWDGVISPPPERSVGWWGGKESGDARLA